MESIRSIALGAALALVISPVVLADQHMKNSTDRPGMVVTETKTVTATVTAIDYKTRKVTLTGQDGNSLTVTAGPEVKNFKQVKKGDQVTIDEVESIALIVTPKGEIAPSAGQTTKVKAAKPGEKPGVVAVRTTQVTATVKEIDYKTRMVTLKAVDGSETTLKVGPQAKRFNEVKKGDQVTVSMTEATAIKVTTPKKK